MKSQIKIIFASKLFKHIAYWTFATIFFGTFWGSINGHYVNTFRNELVTLPVKMIVTYFTLYFLIPRFLMVKKYMLFLLGLFITLIIGGLIQQRVAIYVLPLPHMPDYNPDSNLNIYHLMHVIVDINTLLVLPMMAKIIEHYYIDKQKAESLSKEKLKAELNFLKNQIHPHFFFNTLNSLYSLTIKKSDKAPEVVLKLSELMRYILHETNPQSVPLIKEINYLKNYIDLEKIRFEKRFEISFNVFGDIAGRNIAPMLLLPFIENSFKHGVNNESDGAWITIEISVKGESLLMKIENSISNTDSRSDSDKKDGGIGLENVRRRLDLIYAGKYDLKINNDGNSYIVVLKLNLAEQEESK